MKYIFFIALSLFSLTNVSAQALPPASPCLTDKIYRQFDFWIGEWEAYSLKGKKSGDSKISLILDSCVILEEWTSVAVPGGFLYTGKSFNSYNATTKQWEQHWIDNVGGGTNYVHGKYEDKKIIFLTEPFQFSKDTMALNKLTFFDLGLDRVRQLGEISKDNGKTWSVQYDLDYRRKKKDKLAKRDKLYPDR